MKIYFLLFLQFISFCILPNIIRAGNNNEKLDLLIDQIRREESDTVRVNLLIDAANLVNNTSGIKYLESALRLAQKENWEKGITESYYTMGWLYLGEAKLQDARTYFLKATEYKGDIGTRVHAYGTASNISLWLKEKDDARKYAEEGLRKAIEADAPEDVLGNARVYMADVYRDDKNMDMTIRNSLIAMEHFKRAHHELGLSISLLYLFSDNVENDFLEYAFDLQKAYNKASTNDQRIYSLSLFKLTSSYLELRKYEKEKENQIIAIVAIMAFLLLITSFLLWQNYTRKKMNARLQKLNDNLDTQNQIKANILGVLNHDLRHPVARLINYLQLKAKAPEVLTKEQTEDMESQTLQMSKSLLQNIEELLIWSKDQMSNNKLDIRQLEVADLFYAMKCFFDYEKVVRIEYHNADNPSFITDELHLEIIMRNLTANAINATKDCPNPLVIWSASKEDDKVILSIKDNGKGMPKENIKQFYEDAKNTAIRAGSGLGTHIIKDLSKKINCRIEIESNLNEGTVISLIFRN